LLRYLRCQERRVALLAAEHKAVIIAELEQQLASIYRYDQDEVWQEAAKAAQKVIGPAQEAVAARCKELGIPERFAPSINWTWSGRGENASVSGGRNCAPSAEPAPRRSRNNSSPTGRAGCSNSKPTS
jgi:hypothetical protein